MYRLRIYRILSVLVTIILASILPAQTQTLPPYLNTDLSVDKRVNDLVGRMTLEEKVSQMTDVASAVERLGIPEYNWWNECLHGVARAGLATVFPQAIGLAATWDTVNLYAVANAISDEARAKNNKALSEGNRSMYRGLTFWSPNINIFRDPRWGRGMETYGEDPYLTGKMGTAFVTGLQGDDPKYLKVVSTVKHYAVHSGPEPERHSFDAEISDRDLYDTYLPHFRETIKAGKAYSLMGAYNRVRGEAACAQELLLNEILRQKWGFNGYIVSDCGAIDDIWNGHKLFKTPEEASALAVKRGCDLNCGNTYLHLVDAVKKGLIPESDIDTAVKRLFKARFLLGMFDPQEKVPYTSIPFSVVNSKEHQSLALETARKSIVLLKNDKNTLPLKKNLGTIAVIGPNADQTDILLGNYNGIPADPVTPLRGIKEKLASQSTKIIYATGCELAENFPVLEVVPSGMLLTESKGVRKNGVTVEYFDNSDFSGKPVATEVTKNIDVNWGEGAPLPSLTPGKFSVRWTCSFVPAQSGNYRIGIKGFPKYKFYLDGKELTNYNGSHEINIFETGIALIAGKSYKIRIDFVDNEKDASMQLLWGKPANGLKAEALAAARQADAVILVMGLSPRLEGEEMRVNVPGFSGGDRTDIELPKTQKELIKAIAKLGKPTVLVLLNGSALATVWEDENLTAILETWYGGQATGTAIADVLFGDYNPGGRLPVTFYRSVDQLPAFENYDMKGRTYKFFEGKVLYPFGHGLSYTSFDYDGLQIPSRLTALQPLKVSVNVTNIGKLDGDEVVQLYLTDLEASAPVPIRKLVGFNRVFLKANETKKLTFTIDPRYLSIITDDSRRIIEPGNFELSVGGKQPGFSDSADAQSTTVVTGRFEITGDPLELEL